MTGRRIGDPKQLVGNGDTPTIGAPRPIGKHDQPGQSQVIAPVLQPVNLLLQSFFGRAGGKAMPYTGIEVGFPPKHSVGGIHCDVNINLRFFSIRSDSDLADDYLTFNGDYNYIQIKIRHGLIIYAKEYGTDDGGYYLSGPNVEYGVNPDDSGLDPASILTVSFSRISTDDP